jgi:3-hydroxymyristoyl/3-hydroxydecanoyl-(acyl carrier protein) dehydratase
LRFTDDIQINALARTVEAKLCVHADADYLSDHFPSAPMLPGLIMLEMAVQSSAALWHACCDQEILLNAELDYVERLHILRRVLPGETLLVKVEMQVNTISDAANFKAHASVDGEAAMRASFRLRSRAAMH